MREPVCIDLFAGCGGLSLGLENVGFKPIFVNEINHDAMETYLVNRVSKYPYLTHYKTYNIKDLVNNDNLLSSFIKGFKNNSAFKP